MATGQNLKSTSSNAGAFSVNVGDTERMASLVAGGLMALYGIGKQSPRGTLIALAGGAIAFRGITGHCGAYSKLGLSTVEKKPTDPASFNRRGVHVTAAFTIQKPKHELYAFWRDFENLPKFMTHLQSVKVLDDKHSEWVTAGPAGIHLKWESMIISDVPDEKIAWVSMAGGDVDNAGSVQFTDAPGDRGTEVKVTLDYIPPLGRIGAAVAKLFGRSGESEVREDLRHFKQMMEAGEIATTAGQPRGA